MKSFSKKVALLFLSIFMVSSLLTGCTSTTTNTEKTENTTNTTYPLEFTDAYDRKVILDKKPERIVSLSPNMTETVSALDSLDRLVGRTDYCDYPVDVKNIESIGDITDPNIEKIVELKPDVVLASSLTKKEVIDKIEQLGINVVVIIEQENFDGAYTLIEKVGQVIDKNEDATKVIEGMKDKIDEVETKVKDAKTNPKIYYVVGFGQYGDYTATGETFISTAIEKSGGLNIAKDVTGWKYSLESIVENDPDIIICPINPEKLKSEFVQTNGYKDLRAVKEGKVFEVDNSKLDRQGPRLAEGLEELAKAIHPELFK
jgi:iron complex transport system substrate-binding protein